MGIKSKLLEAFDDSMMQSPSDKYNLSRLADYMATYRNFYEEKGALDIIEEKLNNLRGVPFSNVHCGGTIISANYIITAAHCVIIKFSHGGLLPEFIFHLLPKEIQVTIGVHDQNIAIANKDYSHSIRGIKVHEMYTGLYTVGGVEDRTNYDYAILTLSSSLTFTDKISLICLPDSSTKMFVDELVIATGWGSDDVPSESGGTRQLKELNMKVWANEDCDKAMKMFGTDKQPIQSTHLCAFGNVTGQEKGMVCSGDLGGPLTVKENGRLV